MFVLFKQIHESLHFEMNGKKAKKKEDEEEEEQEEEEKEQVLIDSYPRTFTLRAHEWFVISTFYFLNKRRWISKFLAYLIIGKCENVRSKYD